MGSSSILQSCVVINKALCNTTKKGEESDFNELQSQNQKKRNNGWNLIQHDLKKDDNYEKQVYVHPLVKCWSNTLSIKSLEMCTESLGSETGSDISETIEESENNSTNYSRTSKCGKKHTTAAATNKTVLSHFPPPLTSINGLQVRPHREGDRLILKATTITAPKSCFKAERLDGRLRLSFWNNTTEDDDRKLLGENGYIRPRKCKENGSRIKGIPTWEPFWVAIS